MTPEEAYEGITSGHDEPDVIIDPNGILTSEGLIPWDKVDRDKDEDEDDA
jgi:hypothetical protein